MSPCDLKFKMIVPSSAGVLIIASGICLYLINNFRKKKSEESGKKRIDDSRCDCCLKPFIIGKGVECWDCKARVCKKSCSHWDLVDNNWHCLFCNHRRSWCKRNDKWFETFGGVEPNAFAIKKIFNTTEVINLEDEHVAFNSDDELAAGGYETTNSMENVRKIIEKIVESLVGNVDNTPIDRLYNHAAYNKFIDEYGVLFSRIIKHLEVSLRNSNKPAADRPSMAHTALRELVGRAVDEARKLPGLGDTVSTRTQQSTSTTIAEQDYEDLLAAAILNKVIEKYQKDADGNVYNSTRKFLKNKNKMMLDKELENELENSPENKLRRRICSDPLSLTIEEQIEEITTTYASDEEPECIKNSVLNFSNAKRVPFPEFGMDIVDPSQESSEEEDDNEDEIDAAHMDHITPVESWEENWLFQKKKIAIKSEPVAMLVPNPSAEYRALIGDKDAEDTSDLSEFSAQSDDEIDEDLIQVINHVRPEESSDTKDSEEETFATVTALADRQDGHPPVSDKMAPACSAFAETIEKNNEDSEDNIKNEIIKECVVTNGHLEEDIEENYRVKNCLDELVAQVPKTPASTPARNSLCEYEVTEINKNFCDLDKLNAKLESIDIDNDEDDSLIIENNNEDNSEENEIEILEIEENTEGKCREAAAKSESKVSGLKSLERSEEVQTDLELSAPPRPGTIAEREHKKWENAAPIENNPYSPENINKRLLERQYATRSSEVTGNSNVLPTSQSPPLQILFGNNRPDIKRFGRDYYINESKSPRGDKFHRPGTSNSNSSRPSSSLSHHSSSIGSDFEQQEVFEPIEATSKLIASENNLDRERKNNKNEINAKLNNQGTNNPDCKNSFDEDKRKIRRIDLRAYGFENEFHVNKDNNNKDLENRRVPNKLDLRSFGYDSGLRRTQSNNHLDSKVNNSFVNLKTNGNDNNNNNEELKKSNLIEGYWNKSTEVLNKEKLIVFEKINRMSSAKSVPNITENYYAIASSSASDEDEKHFIERLTSDNDEIKRFDSSMKDHHRIIKLVDRDAENSGDFNSYETDSQSSKTESSEELPRRFSTIKDIKYSLESLDGGDKFVDKELPMPSVKKLAQAFNHTSENTKTPKILKNVVKDRPTTPEIQIVKTPRQMHSLTARSLSKEFREGLRQISVKPQVQSLIIEATEKNSTNLDKSIDIDVIAPGKIKNELEFWEQLQKRN